MMMHSYERTPEGAPVGKRFRTQRRQTAIRVPLPSEHLIVTREWSELEGKYWIDAISASDQNSRALAELEANPGTQIYHKFAGGTGDTRVEVTYFAESGDVMVCGNAESQTVDSSYFPGDTPERIMDTVIDAYVNQEEEDDARFC
jgi:hypothetical protein